MTGICATVRHVDGYTLVDMFATMSAATNQLQSMALTSLTTTAAGGFVQGSTPNLKGWAPDVNFTSSMDSLDSFVTLGGSTYGNPSGPYLANGSLLPGFWPTGTWNGTPWSAPANSIAVPAGEGRLGWSTVSTDAKSRAIILEGLGDRIAVQGLSASSSYGAWFAHLVVAGDGPFQITMSDWLAAWCANVGSNPTDYPPVGANATFTVPAPGALALFLCAGRRRARRA